MGNFEFKKKFGQNFLTDKNLLNQIVEKAEVSSEDTIVEIGAGKGALTEVLSKKAKKVYAFEIDKELFDFLTEKFEGTNVQLEFKDIMKVSDSELNELVGSKFKLVANLPYYITSPIITRFLQNEMVESVTVMVQEEVADRIVASPKTKQYGVLSVICQLFGEPKKVLRVNRKMFFPVPNVDSAVIKIDKNKDINVDNTIKFIAFVKKCFAMKRKKLSSNLVTNKLDKIQIENQLGVMGLSASARAEELSISDFASLFSFWSDKNS